MCDAICESDGTINDTDSDDDDWHSAPVCSDGSYGVEQDLISSFPNRIQLGKWQIVPGVPVNEFTRAKIDAQSMN